LSKHGLVDNEVRKIAWPILLNIHEEVEVRGLSREDNTSTPKFIIADKDQEWKKHTDLKNKKMADQIEKDVNRSLNHFNLSFAINSYRKQLSDMMNALFQLNPRWSYYQGFNDVSSVFLVFNTSV
jgi:hypothetical protein